MVNIWWVGNAKGMWDESLLLRTLRGDYGVLPFDFVEYTDKYPPENQGAVVILSGMMASRVESFKDAIEYMEKLPWVILMHTSDESHEFDSLKYMNRFKVWRWYSIPHFRTGHRNPVIGCPEDTVRIMRDMDRKPLSERKNQFAFAGQPGNEIRQFCVEELKKENGVTIVSPGFSQGLDRTEYLRLLTESRIIPCPTGTVSPDSFRLFEGITAGCLPITDKRSPGWSDSVDFWELQGDVPFPKIDNWNEIHSLLEKYRADPIKLQQDANLVGSWWLMYQREFRNNLIEDIKDFAPEEIDEEPLTVLVSSSPIKSHPDTAILDECVSRIRGYLPNAEILIMLDSVRPEQSHYLANYTEYVRRVIDKCVYEWTNVFPIVFTEHLHQAEITRRTLRKVTTPLIAYFEHDTYLKGNIPFGDIVGCFANPDVNLIRFSIFHKILDEHLYLFPEERQRRIINNVPLTKTVMYSQRPHVARKDFYEWMLYTLIPENQKTMIEDAVIGYAQDGSFKMWMYNPEEEDITYSFHLNGRAGDTQFIRD